MANRSKLILLLSPLFMSCHTTVAGANPLQATAECGSGIIQILQKANTKRHLLLTYLKVSTDQQKLALCDTNKDIDKGGKGG